MARQKKMRRLRRWIILILVLALVGAGVWQIGLPMLKASITTTYDEYTATIGSISNALSFSGSFALKDSETLTASQAAMVRTIYVEEGQQVAKGDRLMRLSDGETLKAGFDGTVNVIGVSEGDEVSAQTQALGMSLTAAGAEQPFSAQWADGALILSGGAGCWRVNGSALRALQNAGVETLVLASGDAAVVLPTAGFASGYAYDRLRAQGLASVAFEYVVDPATETVQLTAQGTTYDLSGEGGDMRLTGAAFGAASALCEKYAADSE